MGSVAALADRRGYGPRHAQHWVSRDVFIDVGRGRVILALVALMALVGAGASQAAGTSSQTGARTLHLRFARTIGTGVEALVASKQYMLVALDNGGYRIYDDARGLSWRIDQRPCGTASLPGPNVPPYGAGMFGAPWVMFYCSKGGFALYNVTTRRWHLIGSSATSGQAFRDAAGSPFEVGAKWIKLTYVGGQDCGDHIHYGCGVAYRFYNIRSGTFRSSPQMSSSTVFDLDSPRLVQNLCPPIQAPPVGPDGPTETFAVLGRFAIEFTLADFPFLNNVAPEVSRGSVPVSWSLEHCGSNSQLSIDAQDQAQYVGALTADNGAVLWSLVNSRGTWNGEIAGRFLPTLQRFTAFLPRKLAGDQGGPVLDSSHIYVLTKRGALWRAPFPTPR